MTDPDVLSRLREALDRAQDEAEDDANPDYDYPEKVRRYARERLRLVERDRALLRVRETADQMVSEHVERCGPALCGHPDYHSPVGYLAALDAVIGGAASFWLGEDNP